MTALSLVYPVQNLINAVAIGFGIGINAVIAYHLGAQEQEKADQAASWGVVWNLVHGAVLTVVCIAVMPRHSWACLRTTGMSSPWASAIPRWLSAFPW